MRKLTPDSILIGVAFSITFVALAVCLVLLIVQPAHVTAPIAHVDPPQVLTGPGATPIARYTPTDRTLTVTAHAPADLLVCFGDGAAHCRLVTDWREK